MPYRTTISHACAWPVRGASGMDAEQTGGSLWCRSEPNESEAPWGMGTAGWSGLRQRSPRCCKIYTYNWHLQNRAHSRW